MTACNHCKRCKEGCTDVCACCGICNACGLQTRPAVAAPAPIFVPVPYAPNWAQPWQPFPNTVEITCGANAAGCAMPFLGECQTVTLTGESQARNFAVFGTHGAAS